MPLLSISPPDVFHLKLTLMEPLFLEANVWTSSRGAALFCLFLSLNSSHGGHWCLAHRHGMCLWPGFSQLLWALRTLAPSKGPGASIWRDCISVSCLWTCRSSLSLKHEHWEKRGLQEMGRSVLGSISLLIWRSDLNAHMPFLVSYACSPPHSFLSGGNLEFPAA